MIDFKEKIITEIKKIYDPEIPVNIYELGLIYKIEVVEKNKVVYGMFAQKYVLKKHLLYCVCAQKYI